MLVPVCILVVVGFAFTRFRRCILIIPIALACVIGGWLANEELWRATGGTSGECTDVCFAAHKPGTASDAFAPLWALTVVLIGAAFVGISALLIRSCLNRRASSHVVPAESIVGEHGPESR
jgi:hypothetical protein